MRFLNVFLAPVSANPRAGPLWLGCVAGLGVQALVALPSSCPPLTRRGRTVNALRSLLNKPQRCLETT